MHTRTSRVTSLVAFGKTMAMSLERRDVLAKTLSLKVIIKDHGPLMSLELPTRNDLVPRCYIYDDSPFELLRYPYMLPSMTITMTCACPHTSNDRATYSLIVGYHCLKDMRKRTTFSSIK